MDKKVFYDVLKKEFAPKLREIGFKGSGQNFYRAKDDVINIINIQANKYGGSCAVNLGLHLSFLPTNTGMDLPEIRNIKEYDCEFRMRLAPRNKMDYWWKYGGLLNSPTKNARHLIKTYFEYGEPHFKEFDEVEKIASMLTLEDIENNDYIKVFGGVVPQCGALAMARIHKHIGNISEAKEFARVGLKNIGRAVALKSAFEEIINAT